MHPSYLGSPEILTSKANQEIVPEKPSNWTVGYSFHKFSFINYDPCRVRINGGNPIYLDAEQGFDVDTKINSQEIRSFVIVESGTRFSWIGGY